MGTLVSVGNGHESFARLLNEVDRLASLELLPKPVVVQHGHTPFRSTVCSGVHQMELAAYERAIQEAAVVIVHAGAGSVLTCLRLGKRPIAMARRPEHGEILDNHQLEFLARMFARRLVVAVEEPGELLTCVREVQGAAEGPAPVVTNVRLQAAVAELVRSMRDRC